MSAVAHTIDEHRHVSHMLQFRVLLRSCPLLLLRPSGYCYVSVCLGVETPLFMSLLLEEQVL